MRGQAANNTSVWSFHCCFVPEAIHFHSGYVALAFYGMVMLEFGITYRQNRIDPCRREPHPSVWTFCYVVLILAWFRPHPRPFVAVNHVDVLNKRLYV